MEQIEHPRCRASRGRGVLRQKEGGEKCLTKPPHDAHPTVTSAQPRAHPTILTTPYCLPSPALCTVCPWVQEHV